ncbi:MAG: hypothetical protein IIA45_04935 [Bacteroidetes bacterium]|nr:hypothetical protein [Bacteroidota bacterium]
MNKQLWFLGLVFMFMIILSACLKDDMERLIKPDYTPEIAIPLLNSTISVDQVLNTFGADSLGFLDIDSDNFMTLVYQGLIFSNRGDEIVTIPNQNFSQSYAVPAMAMNGFTLKDSISLGQITTILGPPTGTAIEAVHGTTSPFPPVPNSSLGNFPYTGSNEFTSITLSSGDLVLSVTNNLPVDLTNVIIDVINNVTTTVIATFSFPIIATGTTASDSADLSGKTLSDNMDIGITSIESPGSIVPVPIDTTDLINFSLTGSNLVVTGGSITIDPLEIQRDTITVNFNSGEDIRTLRVKTGNFIYSGTSTFGNGLQLTLSIPFLTKNSVPFSQTFGINAQNQSFPLAGYEFDLSCGGALSNSIIVVFEVSSGGNIVSFNAGDTIVATMNANNMKLEYADGYLGRQIFSIDEDTLTMNIYGNYVSGSVMFENPTIDIYIDNSYGFPITANFNILNAINNNGVVTNLIMPGSLNDSIVLNYPLYPAVGDLERTTINMDKNNSNLSQVIATSPYSIRYGVSVVGNSAGNQGNIDFVTDSSYISVSVDVAFPLHGRITSIVVQDTFDLNIQLLEVIQYATFVLVTENGFPLDVGLQLIFVDSVGPNNYIHIDSLFDSDENLLVSGTIDGNGRVNNPSTKRTEVFYNQTRFAEIKKANKLILKARLSSIDNGTTPIKLYSDYFVQVNLGIKAGFKFDLTKKE